MSLITKISICLLLSLLLYSTSRGQVDVKKETIYISYQESPKHKKIGKEDKIRFIMGSESFLYEASKNCKRKVAYNQIKDRLITIQLAKKKVDEYLNKVAEKWQEKTKNKEDKKIAGFLKNPIVPYYNDYFNGIYVFEKLNKQEGILYEVSWESFIE